MDKGLLTTISIILLIIVLGLTGGFAMGMLLSFDKLKFTPESKASGSYTAFWSLLLVEIILSVIAIFVVIGFIVAFEVKKVKAEREGKKKSMEMTIPMITLILTLITISFIKIVLYFQWSNLTVVDKSSPHYQFIRSFIFISPMIYVAFTILVAGGWWWIKTYGELSTLRKEKKTTLEKEEEQRRKEKELEERELKEEAERVRKEKLIKQQVREAEKGLQQKRKELQKVSGKEETRGIFG